MPSGDLVDNMSSSSQHTNNGEQIDQETSHRELRQDDAGGSNEELVVESQTDVSQTERSKWKMQMPEGKIIFRRCAVIGVPLLCCPLLFFGKEIRCVFLLLVMSLYWLFEVAPIGMVSLLPLCLIPMLGLVTAKEIGKTYFSDSNILFLASLIMAIAVEEVSLHRRIAYKCLSIVGTGKLRILFGFYAVTAFVSFFVSDTAATTLMLPIGLAILNAMHSAQHQLDSTSSTSTSHIQEKDSLDLSKMDQSERGFCKTLVLIAAHGSLVGGTGVITGTGPNTALLGQTEHLETPVKITYLTWLWCSLPVLWICIFIDFFNVVLILMRPSGVFASFRRTTMKDKVQNDAQKKLIQEKYAELGPIRFAEMSVIIIFSLAMLGWLTRDFGASPGWGYIFQSCGKKGKMDKYVSDGSYGIFICFLLFIWPRDPFTDRKLTPILTWDSMKRKFSFSSLMLIGAGYALSKAVMESELGDLIALKLEGSLRDVPSIVVQLVCMVCAFVMTQFNSNVATANVFLPILDTLAKALHVNPLYLMFPVAITCSFAFLFPMSSPPNAIVYDTGYITMVEMILCGLMSGLLCNLVNFGNMNTWAYWVMKMDTNTLGDANFHSECEVPATTLPPCAPLNVTTASSMAAGALLRTLASSTMNSLNSTTIA